MQLAEREGFEPSVEFPLHTLSKRAPSASRPSLRTKVAGPSILASRTGSPLIAMRHLRPWLGVWRVSTLPAADRRDAKAPEEIGENLTALPISPQQSRQASFLTIYSFDSIILSSLLFVRGMGH
jgi:hypothetical protein